MKLSSLSISLSTQFFLWALFLKNSISLHLSLSLQFCCQNKSFSTSAFLNSLSMKKILFFLKLFTLSVSKIFPTLPSKFKNFQSKLWQHSLHINHFYSLPCFSSFPNTWKSENDELASQHIWFSLRKSTASTNQFPCLAQLAAYPLRTVFRSKSLIKNITSLDILQTCKFLTTITRNTV